MGELYREDGCQAVVAKEGRRTEDETYRRSQRPKRQT